MEFSARTYSVLSVAAAEKFHTSLREMLPREQYAPVHSVRDAAEARRCILERSYDIIVISAPLPDEFGTRLAQHAADRSGAGVLLMVRAEHYSDISAQATPYGVLTLQKPTSTQMMLQCMELLCATRERIRRMEQKTGSVEEKMAEIRLVNRAKWVLIHQGLTEEEAHRQIEKASMDRCVPKRTIAEEILNGG